MTCISKTKFFKYNKEYEYTIEYSNNAWYFYIPELDITFTYSTFSHFFTAPAIKYLKTYYFDLANGFADNKSVKVKRSGYTSYTDDHPYFNWKPKVQLSMF